MAYPGVYPDDDKIIPHSPRREFGFASKIEDVQKMSKQVNNKDRIYGNKKRM